VRAELEVLGLDASRHVVDFYSALLDRLNVVRSKDLLTTRSQSHVLVAGVKVSTQTPPVRSGRRVVFLTMDDSTGPVDVAFFDSTSAQTLHQVFSGWLLVIRGVTRRTGPKGISIRGLQAWDLTQLYEVYQSEGLGAVLDLLAPEPEVKRYDQRAKSGTMKP
jgi:error-prone DNA polymerase